MSSAKPTREQADLADVLELILDKGIVINADIAITVGQTEMIGIEIRAAIASFETAAEYGLAFPSGTDMRRVEQASGRESLEKGDEIDLGIGANKDDESQGTTTDPPGRRPEPSIPFSLGEERTDDESENHSESDDSEEDSEQNGSDREEGPTDENPEQREQADSQEESPETESEEQ